MGVTPHLIESSRKSNYGYNYPTVTQFTGKVVYGSMKENLDGRRSILVLLRQRKGLTQEDLAKALEVTDHTIRNWEKGRSEPKLTIKQMKVLCRVLGCQLEELPDTFNPD